MSVTKLMSSKANVKQYSAADLPMQPKQAVIARMAPVESTANQTVINLPWYVDTLNAQESFFLCIDGKILSIGAANDFTMTSVDVLGFSNQVTLTAPLVAGLNIQAWKLGAKKESEFAQDQRFVNIYENLAKSFQGYVDQSQLMTATSSAGTPAAGTFYSSVQNRAAMADMRQDLRSRMAIDRITSQSIYAISNEVGPNGENVWGVQGDIMNQMRFVGNGWQNINNNNGLAPNTGTLNDYAEITFYGTGLNVLVVGTEASRDIRASTDGGAEGANLITNSSTHSAILQTRNYAPNVVIPAVSGLSLGVHTVRLRINAAVSTSYSGFEVLNESANVITNPGIVYNEGKKITTSLQNSTAYTSGVTGTRGGRMLVYQASDGTIGRAFQAVDASQGNLSGASHANEEIVRAYNFREFGANRSDDFSSLTPSTSARAFTLDDGTTSVVSDAANYQADGLRLNSTNNYLLITFVGTGLDIQGTTSISVDSHAIFVDGVSIGSLSPDLSSVFKTTKIVSGLPYGTHTVRIVRSNNVGFSWVLNNFFVYQPKKPTLPSSAVEIADYNVMADYSATNVSGVAAADNADMYQGVLMKATTREMTYVGTWSAPVLDTSFVTPSGFYPNCTTNSSFMEYTFFGTGIGIQFIDSAAGTVTYTVAIDGVNTAGAVNLLSVTDNGSGSYTTNTAVGGRPARLVFTGLSLGKHTIRITRTAGSGGMAPVSLYVITPIHTHRSNVPLDIQNTLPVGSNAIADSRKLTPIKDVGLQTKNVSQAVSVAANPSTTSTTAIPMPDMSVVHRNTSGKIKISYSIQHSNSGAGGISSLRVYVDGVPVGQQKNNVFQSGGAGTAVTTSDAFVLNVSPGVHKVDIYWFTNAFTHYVISDGTRTLLVEEV